MAGRNSDPYMHNACPSLTTAETVNRVSRAIEGKKGVFPKKNDVLNGAKMTRKRGQNFNWGKAETSEELKII